MVTMEVTTEEMFDFFKRTNLIFTFEMIAVSQISVHRGRIVDKIFIILTVPPRALRLQAKYIFNGALRSFPSRNAI